MFERDPEVEQRVHSLSAHGSTPRGDRLGETDVRDIRSRAHFDDLSAEGSAAYRSFVNVFLQDLGWLRIVDG